MLLSALQRAYPLINLVIFKLVWVNSVLLQNAGLWITALLITVNLALTPSLLRDLRFAGAVTLLGVVMDYGLSLAGVYLFPGPFIPLWLILLWFTFGQTLAHGYRILMRLPLALFILLGAVAGPLSYIVGWKLGAVAFGLSLAVTFALVATAWAVLMPLILLANRYTHEKVIA